MQTVCLLSQVTDYDAYNIFSENIIECKEYLKISPDSIPTNELTITTNLSECPLVYNYPIHFYAPRHGTPGISAQKGTYYLDKVSDNGDGTLTITMYDCTFKLNKFKTHGDFFCGQTFQQAIYNLFTWCGFKSKTNQQQKDCRDMYWHLTDTNNPYRESKLYGEISNDVSIKNAINQIALSLGLYVRMNTNGRMTFKPLTLSSSGAYTELTDSNICVGSGFVSQDKVDFVEIKQNYDWTFDSTDYYMHKYHTNTMPNFTADTNYEGHKYFGNYYWLPWMMYSFNGELRSKMNYSVWTGDDIPPRFSVDPSVTDCPSSVPSNMTAYYLKCLIDTPASSGLQPQVRNGIGTYKGCNTTSRITYPYSGEITERWANYNLQSYTQNIGLFSENMVDPEDGCNFYNYETLAENLYKWLNPVKTLKAKIYYPLYYDAVGVGEIVKYGDNYGIITEQNIDYTKSRDITDCIIKFFE